MPVLIEPLESRTLLSATVIQAAGVEQAMLALQKEAKQARIDAAASAKTEGADVRAVKADLQRLKGVPANARLLKLFTKQEQAGYRQFKQEAGAVAKSISTVTRRAISDGINFILHPGNARVTAKLAVDLLALQKLTTSGPALKLVADVKSSVIVVTDDLNSIIAADGGDAKTVNDSTQAITDLANSSSTLQADANALNADLNTLIEALKAVQTM